MINRKGLELIKQLQSHPPELNELLINDRIPPIFKLFLRHYQVGGGAIFGEKIILDDKNSDEYWLSAITMYEHVEMNEEKYHAVLDYIYDYKSLLNELSQYKSKSENWHEYGLIQIGLMHWSDVLLLGVEDHNKDQIWRYGEGLSDKNQCTKLENDVFQFLSKLSERISAEDLNDWGVNQEQIYRNVNEHIWRVKK